MSKRGNLGFPGKASQQREDVLHSKETREEQLRIQRGKPSLKKQAAKIKRNKRAKLSRRRNR